MYGEMLSLRAEQEAQGIGMNLPLAIPVSSGG